MGIHIKFEELLLIIICSLFYEIVHAQAQCTAEYSYSLNGMEISVTDKSQVSSIGGSGEVPPAIENWIIDFGDGSENYQSSTKPKNIKYTYAAVGTYDVCLYISTNIQCTNSTCKSIEISNGTSTSVLSNNKYFEINVFPNPAKSNLYITMPLSLENNAVFKIFNLIGQTVLEGNLSRFDNTINIDYLSMGSYRISIYTKDRLIFKENIIITD